MSNLRPDGVPVNFDGSDRHFLFTLRTIDELQYMHPATSIFRMIEEAGKDTLEGLLYLVDIVYALCGGELSRTDIMQSLKTNTLTGGGSLQTVRAAIDLALVESMPIPDDRDEPEQKEDKAGIIEIPKFLIIAMTRFQMTEDAAWNLTLRKFSLLNDAYMTINGMKKADDDYMPLSMLP